MDKLPSIKKLMANQIEHQRIHNTYESELEAVLSAVRDLPIYKTCSEQLELLAVQFYKEVCE